MDILSHQKAGAGGEIQLTDAIAQMIGKTDVFGYRFEGTRYDCGSLAGFVAANVAFALDRPDMREKVLAELAEVYKRADVI
jgi:UTP--glucose-1-phosphate uridylyltransferase